MLIPKKAVPGPTKTGQKKDAVYNQSPNTGSTLDANVDEDAA
jgi:hypothetical protein